MAITSWTCSFCKAFNYRLTNPTKCCRCKKRRPGVPR